MVAASEHPDRAPRGSLRPPDGHRRRDVAVPRCRTALVIDVDATRVTTPGENEQAARVAAPAAPCRRDGDPVYCKVHSSAILAACRRLTPSSSTPAASPTTT